MIFEVEERGRQREKVENLWHLQVSMVALPLLIILSSLELSCRLYESDRGLGLSCFPRHQAVLNEALSLVPQPGPIRRKVSTFVLLAYITKTFLQVFRDINGDIL